MIKNRFVKSVVLEGKGKLSVKNFPYPELKKNCAIIRKGTFRYFVALDKHSF
jgi:hypothetical protein